MDVVPIIPSDYTWSFLKMVMMSYPFGILTRKLQTAGMTSKLEIRYKHPLSVNDSQYTIHAHITNRRAHLVFMSATIENAKGEVCVEAESVYYAFDEEKAKEMGFSHCDVENEQLLSM